MSGRTIGFRSASLAAALALAASPAFGAGSVSLSAGVRGMDEQYWAPVENQPMLGVLADFSFWRAPIALAVGIQSSSDQADNVFDPGTGTTLGVEASVVELSAGVKYLRPSGLVRPFAGAGIVSTRVEYEVRTSSARASDADSATGYYLEGGLQFRFALQFHAGFSLRAVGGTDVELFGQPGDADAVIVSAVGGYSWGGIERRRRPRRPDPGETD